MKIRLDLLLVERGHFPTRTKAQAALMAGKVRIQGKDAPKPGDMVQRDCLVEIVPDACPYVSRGGFKLAGALDAFRLNPVGRTVLDLGASTGGFTDCLLKRGAAKVYAVDVGHGQLDASLRADPRVVNLEKTHARDLSPETFAPGPTLAVVDVSFISLTMVLPPLLACLARPADVVALIKPQFELEPKKTPKGIVKDEAHRQEALERVRAAAAALGLEERGCIDSPLAGAKGNVEFLIHWRRR
ncbi:MAG: 23S rRNA (cytidine1920-2'-O)/16S rRNA (cytidine1409-2'-O)-methyltransferase [Elusimicrobia bacterium]|nr:MAG: 23S rRNA (cytidine1920-2'-O)/16S rRNA (cytidine1409-2'-O)-methyltransferase [Elusimicrobiota bacterium]